VPDASLVVYHGKPEVRLKGVGVCVLIEPSFQFELRIEVPERGTALSIFRLSERIVLERIRQRFSRFMGALFSVIGHHFARHSSALAGNFTF